MIPFERFAAERIVKRADVAMTPEIQAQLVFLLQGVKGGDFCCLIENRNILPERLWEEGVEGGALPQKALVIQGNRLYLQKTWGLETWTLEKVSSLLRRPVYKGDYARFQKSLSLIEERLNSAQKQAIEQSFEKGFSLFTGGPGTGKSYAAGCFIRLLAESQEMRFKAIIAAPTGKAAAHLESALQKQWVLPANLQWESTTLHRLLRLQPYQQRLHSQQLIDADLVVVDEASMLDASLLLHLLNAIGPKTRLLLLGDPNQLPPVEGNGFFPELAELFGHRLTVSMRMGEGSLFQLAQAILDEDPVEVFQIQSEAVQWLPWMDDLSELAKLLYSLLPSVHYWERPDPSEVLQRQNQFRILSALRRGPLGVDALNRKIMELISQEKQSGWTVIPILIVQSNRAQRLYNGTMGVLIREGSRSMAYFSLPEGVQAIPEVALPPYELAFCLSVHKSQGSEFEEVVVLLGPGAERFGKEAFYTAVTRAKKRVRLCVDREMICKSLGLGGRKRSGFRERIGAYLNEASCVI